MKKPDESIQDMRKAYSLNPINFYSLINIIDILFTNNRQEDAREYLDKAARQTWTTEQSVLFAFFSWLLKRINGEDVAEETRTIFQWEKMGHPVDYNFGEVTEWVNQAPLDPVLKQEIKNMLDKFAAKNTYKG
jgi:hypothetical protein